MILECVMQTKAQPTLLTAREVGEILRISPAAVYKHATTGVLPSIRVGGSVRFSKAIIVGVVSKTGTPWHRTGE